jgi:hypothetical protein
MTLPGPMVISFEVSDQISSSTSPSASPNERLHEEQPTDHENAGL